MGQPLGPPVRCSVLTKVFLTRGSVYFLNIVFTCTEDFRFQEWLILARISICRYLNEMKCFLEVGHIECKKSEDFMPISKM
jgi:hypothetical protein